MLVAALCVLGLLPVWLLPGRARRSADPPPEFSRIATAFSEYAKECRRRGQAVPSLVTPEMLVASGHLRQQDVKALAGIRLIFHGDADETRPQRLMVEAQMPDGSWLAVLGDGSVQQLTQARLDAIRTQSGQQ